MPYTVPITGRCGALLTEKVVVIDWRCSVCSTVRRIDAEAIYKPLNYYMPTNWSSNGEKIVCEGCVLPHPLGTTTSQSDVLREKASATRMPTADLSILKQNITDAPVPMASDLCGICERDIAEGEAWRPDPEITTRMVKVHRVCLTTRAKERDADRE